MKIKKNKGVDLGSVPGQAAKRPTAPPDHWSCIFQVTPKASWTLLLNAQGLLEALDGEPKRSHLGQVAGWHVRGSGGKLTGSGVVVGLVGRGEEEAGAESTMAPPETGAGGGAGWRGAGQAERQGEKPTTTAMSSHSQKQLVTQETASLEDTAPRTPPGPGHSLGA